MKTFEELVNEQMQVMDQLLSIQTELDESRELEEKLRCNQKESELQTVQKKIHIMRKELNSIQTVFMNLTEMVIESYQMK